MSTIFKSICQAHSQEVTEYLRAARILASGQHLSNFLHTNRLADKDEEVFQVFDRSTKFLADAGKNYYGSSEALEWHQKFLRVVSEFKVILGSPMLTNAGRRDKSVSACSVPPLKLSEMKREEIARMVGDYHTRGMGTGFCLDDVKEPSEMVCYLNHVAMSEVQKGMIERSCGNMGVLSIHHPKVLSFIKVKQDNPHIKDWKFNLSVNITDAFIEALERKEPFQLSDGHKVDPEFLMSQIAEHAHATGDPGLIFMDRINRLNRVPQMGKYETVVPCGEVSLFSGEVCQFSYLNLPQFLKGDQIDWQALKESIHICMMILDNAVEVNIERMPTKRSAEVISSLRRVGIGICGFSEVLQAKRLVYGSLEAQNFAKELMSFINLESKRASVKLAKERGPFEKFKNSTTRLDLFTKPFENVPTDGATREDWQALSQQIQEVGIRNLSTTIIPPSGRSSLIAGVTASIEPPFTLVADQKFKTILEKQARQEGYFQDLGAVYDSIQKTGSLQQTNLPLTIKRVYRTALEMSAQEHIAITTAFQSHTDEGISKTVNLVENSTVKDVDEVFRSAICALNMKGITIYREYSRTLQPKTLSTNSKETPMVIDSIYGPIKVTPKIAKILASPLMERLKTIHQNGIAYLVDPRQSTSRYEHSLGTMALAKMLGASEKEQIQALLHDVSHTPFSHLIDLVYGHEKQDYHERHKGRFLSQKWIQNLLFECDIPLSDIEIKDSLFFQKNGINIDRLDYMIRDLKAVGRIFQPEYSSILNNLVVEEGRIKCRDIDTAKLLFEKFLEVNEEVYFDPKVEAASVAFSEILKKMLKEGSIKEEDFEKSEENLLEKIRNSRFKADFEAIGAHTQKGLSPCKNGRLPVLRKLRYIDPEISGLSGTLSDWDSQTKVRLEEYLNKTPTELYYNG
ncbi:MAG: HD domain-containing protein [Chlamydiae bacterium]|nr:HD domain-containing protein [Chlamydiota bacterium]